MANPQHRTETRHHTETQTLDVAALGLIFRRPEATALKRVWLCKAQGRGWLNVETARSCYRKSDGARSGLRRKLPRCRAG